MGRLEESNPPYHPSDVSAGDVSIPKNKIQGLICKWRSNNSTLQHLPYHSVLPYTAPSMNSKHQYEYSHKETTYNNTFTTSVIISPLATSILSTPRTPSALVGPTLITKTLFLSSSACLSNRKAEKVDRVVPMMRTLSERSMSRKLRDEV